MLGSSRRGFYFKKIDISGILRHAHVEEIPLLLIFGHSDALGRLSKAIGVSKSYEPFLLRGGVR